MQSLAASQPTEPRLVPDDVPPDEFMLETDPQGPEVPLRAATLPALVKILVAAFDEEGRVRTHAGRLPQVVLLMHRWFTTSPMLAQLLMTLHRDARAANLPCRSGDQANHEEWQTRICYAFRYWITQFPMQFDLESELSTHLKEFQATLSPTQAQLVDLSQVPSYDWMRHVSVRNNNGPPAALQVSLVLNQLEPMELAGHITFLEHKVIRRICFEDLKRYAESGSLSESPRLQHSVALFNGLTQWIQCMVLSRTTPHQRAAVIAKFVLVAQKLLELQNFNSLMAVVGSVDHSVLARLSKTMGCLSARTKKTLAELTELLSSANNFGNYRRALASCTGFKIPILGLHLKDVTCLHVALADRLPGGLVNVRKMAHLAVVFHELEELQMSAPPVEANPDLVNTLRLSLDLAYTDDEIYELSLAREPRTCNSPQCSPTQQSVVFAEWAAGPAPPPDPQTIEKHVNAMVEAVFKNYDTDHDGYISHHEFDAVAGNFPFIASFGVLDADHDGMISQDEMKKYFIHANCHALKSGFKHDFHETTYFKPTFCAHCAGLLWGLIRQGYKCRDCSINAHKHCKDLVVVECRQRSPSVSDGLGGSVSARRKFRRKKKSSASESSESTSGSSLTASSLTFGECESLYHLSDSGGGSLPASPKPMGPRRTVSDASRPGGPALGVPVDAGLQCTCHVDMLAHAELKLASAEEASQPSDCDKRLAKENAFLLTELELAFTQADKLRDQEACDDSTPAEL